jgi:hypothetical protein
VSAPLCVNVTAFGAPDVPLPETVISPECEPTPLAVCVTLFQFPLIAIVTFYNTATNICTVLLLLPVISDLMMLALQLELNAVPQLTF